VFIVLVRLGGLDVRVVFEARYASCIRQEMLSCVMMHSKLVGLALLYGLSLDMLLYWTVWLACNLKNKLVCIEHIHQFTKIPSEASLIDS
jgi:hypothetical protein